MYNSMDKLKKALSLRESEEDQGIVTQISDATTLSWSTRIKGFLICFILGTGLSILGSCLFFLPNNGTIIFAVLYTIGNILSLASTCFLMGPVNQIKKMFAATRVFATILVFVFMALTLISAFAITKVKALTLIFCVLQFFALAWYSISYIPFARDAIKKCFAACIE